ncbi:kp78a-related [Anaeramoeba flamelloides]|uniref:Kp78a-related n=1 Tax=Anaeramoeba flamelloides TaxID=1746091 RepID=A0AAV7Z8L7_9EUKA|nr:kp78a-related [Anaeramoeba flamelloides]
MNFSGNISDYQIKEVIGVGSYGKVKLAVHLPTRQLVAIKIINQSVFHLKKKEYRQLLREISILQTLDHKHVIKLFDIIQTKNAWLIVTEYSGGGELFDYLVQHKKLKESVARISYCHFHNIVHRDLKLENLLLDKNLNLKIIDFGLSNFQQKDQLLKSFCGSPTYSAPEILKQEQYSGFKIDVWSMGVILYILVVGKPPFVSMNAKGLFDKIITGSYIIPSYLSEGLINLLPRMLCVDPNKRISVQEILDHKWVVAEMGKIENQEIESKCIVPMIDPLIVLKIIEKGDSFENVMNDLDNNKNSKYRATYNIYMKMSKEGTFEMNNSIFDSFQIPNTKQSKKKKKKKKQKKKILIKKRIPKKNLLKKPKRNWKYFPKKKSKKKKNSNSSSSKNQKLKNENNNFKKTNNMIINKMKKQQISINYSSSDSDNEIPNYYNVDVFGDNDDDDVDVDVDIFSDNQSLSNFDNLSINNKNFDSVDNYLEKDSNILKTKDLKKILEMEDNAIINDEGNGQEEGNVGNGQEEGNELLFDKLKSNIKDKNRGVNGGGRVYVDVDENQIDHGKFVGYKNELLSGIGEKKKSHKRQLKDQNRNNMDLDLIKNGGKHKHRNEKKQSSKRKKNKLKKSHSVTNEISIRGKLKKKMKRDLTISSFLQFSQKTNGNQNDNLDFKSSSSLYEEGEEEINQFKGPINPAIITIKSPKYLLKVCLGVFKDLQIKWKYRSKYLLECSIENKEELSENLILFENSFIVVNYQEDEIDFLIEIIKIPNLKNVKTVRFQRVQSSMGLYAKYYDLITEKIAKKLYKELKK